MYSDSTPFTKPESFYGRFVVDLRFETYHLCCILIKNEFCKCGCKGWCTIDPIHRFLVSVLSAWAIRRNPLSRHDNKPWRASDSIRANEAGKALPCWGALIEHRGDWPELCFVAGFKGHRSSSCCLGLALHWLKQQ